MEAQNVYESIRAKFYEKIKENQLLDSIIDVHAKTLSSEEAIGNPDRKDFPLLKGKEKLMQAEFKGHFGQAFTDMPGNFKGTLNEIVHMPIQSNYDAAIFIASLNAVMSYLGLTSNTIHCKNNDTEQCAEKLVSHIRSNYNNPKIALIGFQPSFLDALSKAFEIRVLDLDKDNVGTKKYDIMIEHGIEKYDDVMEWCDLVIATGSTVVNNTILNFIKDKPVIFFGTSVAGTASLLNLNRFCEYSK